MRKRSSFHLLSSSYLLTNIFDRVPSAMIERTRAGQRLFMQILVVGKFEPAFQMRFRTQHGKPLGALAQCPAAVPSDHATRPDDGRRNWCPCSPWPWNSHAANLASQEQSYPTSQFMPATASDTCTAMSEYGFELGAFSTSGATCLRNRLRALSHSAGVGSRSKKPRYAIGKIAAIQHGLRLSLALLEAADAVEHFCLLGIIARIEERRPFPHRSARRYACQIRIVFFSPRGFCVVYRLAYQR